MDRVPNARIRELCKVKKGVDERWFTHEERMENNRIAKRVYVGESAGSHSMGKLQKRWIYTVKDF